VRDRAVGIDVAGESAWLVALDLDPGCPRVVDCVLVHPLATTELVAFCRTAAAVAIDAPGGPSVGAHLSDASVVKKFRSARCAEVALWRAGISVAWATPLSGAPAFPRWMEAGFAIWRALTEAGHAPLETYPHGVFWRLAGRPLLHKQRPTGSAARLAALASAVTLPIGAAMWSHDGLDALAAALVASQQVTGRAEEISCARDTAVQGHDGSSMWLPRTPPAETESKEVI
jgi:predicted nuclease with RNAse H fold